MVRRPAISKIYHFLIGWNCNYRIVKGLLIGVGLSNQPIIFGKQKHLIFRYWLKSVIIWALPNLPFLINKGW